jgi:hypothetical protein
MPPTPPQPRLIKAGIALLEPVQRVIALQYNPDSLSRTLQAQTAGGEGQDGRGEPMRFKGPPIETIKLEAEIDAADQMEKGDGVVGQWGILPQLSALESLVYPTTQQLRDTHDMAGRGTLEIAPILAPLAVFVWSENRVVPVKVTDFSVTEEAFDPSLNPLRAKVSLGMRVLNVADLGFETRGGSLYMEYQRQKERAARNVHAVLTSLGVQRI